MARSRIKAKINWARAPAAPPPRSQFSLAEQMRETIEAVSRAGIHAAEMQKREQKKRKAEEAEQRERFRQAMEDAVKAFG